MEMSSHYKKTQTNTTKPKVINAFSGKGQELVSSLACIMVLILLSFAVFFFLFFFPFFFGLFVCFFVSLK